MTLVEIKKLQQSWDAKIQEISNRIDPKLFGVLNIKDLLGSHYENDALKDQYLELVYPLTTQRFNELKSAKDEYKLSFLKDMSEILPIIGYSTSGEEVSSITSLNDDIAYYCFELETILDSINDSIELYYPRPFWMKSDYTLFSGAESVIMTSAASPSKYIQHNRYKLQRTNAVTRLEQLEDAILIKNKLFDYPVNVPVLAEHEDSRIPGIVQTSIHRHLILKSMVENKIEGLYFRSNIDKDGNVEITKTGYYN